MSIFGRETSIATSGSAGCAAGCTVVGVVEANQRFVDAWADRDRQCRDAIRRIEGVELVQSLQHLARGRACRRVGVEASGDQLVERGEVDVVRRRRYPWREPSRRVGGAPCTKCSIVAPTSRCPRPARSGRRARDPRGSRNASKRRWSAVRYSSSCGEGGDTEVAQLDLAAAVDQQVLRLDVTVDDAALMSGDKGGSRLARDEHRLLHGQARLRLALAGRATGRPPTRPRRTPSRAPGRRRGRSTRSGRSRGDGR